MRCSKATHITHRPQYPDADPLVKFLPIPSPSDGFFRNIYTVLFVYTVTLLQHLLLPCGQGSFIRETHSFACNIFAYKTTTSQGTLVRAGRRGCGVEVQCVCECECVCVCIPVCFSGGGGESAVGVYKLETVANKYCIHLRCLLSIVLTTLVYSLQETWFKEHTAHNITPVTLLKYFESHTACPFSC